MKKMNFVIDPMHADKSKEPSSNTIGALDEVIIRTKIVGRDYIQLII